MVYVTLSNQMHLLSLFVTDFLYFLYLIINAQPLFKLCAKNGLVGSMVMREIGPLKKRLIANDRLPKEWTINVGYRDR